MGQGGQMESGSFPALASLAFLACTIDPFEMHALARSLHTLTHLALHDCPSVSSHALAPLVEANPALSSLALHGTTYHLFSAPPFRSLLLLSSPRLHTLDLSGLPSFRPGMLAPCSGLHSLTLKGKAEKLAAPRAAGPAAEAEAAAAIVRAVNPRNGEGREYVDVRTAAAARADLIESSQDVVTLLKAAQECHIAVPSASHSARLARAQRRDAVSEIKYATRKIRAGISTWRSLRVAVSQKNEATAREDALSEAFAAATTAGVFVDTRSRVGEGEGGLARLEDFDGMVLDHDLPVDGADGAQGSDDEGEIGGISAAVDPQAHALGVMESLLQQFHEQSNAATESSQPQSFESLSFADAFGRLKRLILVSCFGLKEEQLLLLLRACLPHAGGPNRGTQ
ncbi:unnamed protein product [Closterium sp. Naga37s-1]|nr:unnamed protein product [Closterium sp. Naga37s-1]